jgi:threonine aldolase
MSIDLRSDTVTRPTPEMRDAMHRAPVGDDVFNEDPSINLLQEKAADLLGTEQALFVPSGTMANQIALLAHTKPGDDVIVGENAHSYLYESGGGGALAGVQFSVVGQGGLFTEKDVEKAINPPDHHYANTSLVIAENSHNRSGGRIFPLDLLSAIRETGNKNGLRFHIDGARLLNSAVAQNINPNCFGKMADSLSMCLSKGLGAPVGSVIAGSSDFIDRAHRYRKMLGGGMRQAGIIAAAGIYAIEHHIDRLAQDHRRAKTMAKGITQIPGLFVDLENVETNIVVAQIRSHDFTGQELVEAAKIGGLDFLALEEKSVRLVFHLHITDETVEKALELLSVAVASLAR